MLGKFRFTQNLEISTWADDILGKSCIYYRFRTCLGIPSRFPDSWISVVSANCLSSKRCRLFHDIKNVSLFAMHEFRMPIEFG